jgi:hypothetical protein
VTYSNLFLGGGGGVSAQNICTYHQAKKLRTWYFFLKFDPTSLSFRLPKDLFLFVTQQKNSKHSVNLYGSTNIIYTWNETHHSELQKRVFFFLATISYQTEMIWTKYYESANETI